jgi:hypothetical protein
MVMPIPCVDIVFASADDVYVLLVVLKPLSVELDNAAKPLDEIARVVVRSLGKVPMPLSSTTLPEKP